MKISKKLIPFIAMISLFVSFAILSYVRIPLAYSNKEQRTLKQFPNLTSQFGTDLNTYSNDQFYFRDAFMQYKSKFQTILGQRNLNGIWVGKEMLFQEGVSLSNHQQEQLTTSLNQFTKQTKLKPKMLIIGDRINLLNNSIYKGMNTIDSLNDIQNLQNGLPDYQFVDVNTVLMNQTDAFYRSDHHYTSKGAYLCFETYRKQFLDNQTRYEYEILPVNTSFQGTLANQSGIRHFYDTVDIYLPKNSDISYLVEIGEHTYTSVYQADKGQSSNAYEVFLGGNHPLVSIKTTAKNEKHLLLVKDSFANAFVPFLLPYYHHITMVDPRYYHDNIYQLIENENINDALFLYGSQTLFKDEALIELCQTEVK